MQQDLNMIFPNQNHKIPLSKLAKKYNRTQRTIAKYAKEFGFSKNREQYENDSKIRRKIAYDLRQTGLKWKEVAEKLNISTSNAQVLAQRYKQSQQNT